MDINRLGNYATAKQINYIKQLMEDLGLDVENVNLVGILKDEASSRINALQKRAYKLGIYKKRKKDEEND